jgi:hypothetical protein
MNSSSLYGTIKSKRLPSQTGYIPILSKAKNIEQTFVMYGLEQTFFTYGLEQTFVTYGLRTNAAPPPQKKNAKLQTHQLMKPEFINF